MTHPAHDRPSPLQHWHADRFGITHVNFTSPPNLTDKPVNSFGILQVSGTSIAHQSCQPRLGSHVPGNLPEKGKIPTKVVRRGCNRSFGPTKQKPSCTGEKWGCTCTKEVLGAAQDFGRPLFPGSKRPFCALSLFGNFPSPRLVFPGPRLVLSTKESKTRKQLGRDEG